MFSIRVRQQYSSSSSLMYQRISFPVQMLSTMQSCGMYDSSGEFLYGEPGYKSDDMLWIRSHRSSVFLLCFACASTIPHAPFCIVADFDLPTIGANGIAISVHAPSAPLDNTVSASPAEIGLPAKSGVSGIVISVVPNVLGLATFSPRLDGFGNSVRRALTPQRREVSVLSKGI